MICGICNTRMVSFGQAKVLKKYDIQYYQCPHCGVVQTESPYWLEEAYSEAINDSDIGLVSRNSENVRITTATILVLFNHYARFVDYAGGYGLFVRMMRDKGFDFLHFDKFCTNLFAKSFTADISGAVHYELVTAFEVFEHLINPVEEIEGIHKLADNILFSTVVLPAHNPKPGYWWYYGLEHGQHTTLYSRKSLGLIAKRLGLRYYGRGSYHLMTPKRIPPSLFWIVSGRKTAPVVATVFHKVLRKRSLLAKDYVAITGNDLI